MIPLVGFLPPTDPRVRCTPQAFSHVGLINTARNLSRVHGPADERRTA